MIATQRIDVWNRRRIKLGFTGTRSGMTAEQRDKFTRMVAARNPAEFHHGDCVGADAEAHVIVREVIPDCIIMGHPPEDPTYRAWCKFDGEYEAKPYLARNRSIVAETDELLATPFEHRPKRRGGTWSTVRHAKRIDKPCLVITPAGSVEQP